MQIQMTAAAITIITLLFNSPLFSQTGPPDTEIYLLEMTNQSGKIRLRPPRNITNRVGYDNQPFFLPSGEAVLYTSIGADGQADIYQYSLADKKTARLTNTPESEYSPTPMPDGRHFSVVRVEADSSQRLWRFPFSGGEPSIILKEIKPVGYHAWGSKNELALFILGNPNSLFLADAVSGRGQRIIGDIGRSLHKVPGRKAISFVHKVSENEWWIKQMDLTSHDNQTIIHTLDGSEDYAWTPTGVLLMGKGSKLFKYDPETEKDWAQIADFDSLGLKSISRLAVSPQGAWLALVSTK